MQYFASNSGLDDEFSSVEELTRTARSGLHLNGDSIPSFDYAAPINAYGLDYWLHESVRPLVEANGLRRGDVWYALQNFSMTLATLATGLRTLLVDRSAAEKQEGFNEDEEDEEVYVVEEDWDKFDDKGKDVEEQETLEPPALSARPVDVSDEDWMVYEAFQSVSKQFYDKWLKMWA